MIWKGGSKYEGQWKNDTRTGSGTKIYGNGDIYSGQWKNAKRHVHFFNLNILILQGEGKMVYQNGNIYEGQWKSDEVILFLSSNQPFCREQVLERWYGKMVLFMKVLGPMESKMVKAQ